MTRFFWVRHGPTHVPRMVGWTDHPADLSDCGQIARLKGALPDAPVISSDLLRARQTAEAIAGSRPRMAPLSALREFHYGAWEDQPFDAIDSPKLRQYFEDPGPHRAPGGESWNDVAKRVNDAINPLLGLSPDIIVVAHMGTILTQWARAAQLAPYAALGQKIDNLSITRIDWDGAKWQAQWANHHP